MAYSFLDHKNALISVRALAPDLDSAHSIQTKKYLINFNYDDLCKDFHNEVCILEHLNGVLDTGAYY